jgi:Transposase, Mutator family
MALSQSVLSDVLDAFRADEGVDLVRDAVRMVMQELIEAEVTEQIGAARYERINTRVTERNGSRPHLVATQASDIELHIPKLRKSSFFPSILEPRRRIDQALYAVVIEDHVNGVSTSATWDQVRDQIGGRFPKIAGLMDDARAEVPGIHELPARPLGEGAVHEPARATQQGSETTRPRCRDLPERGLGDPPRRRRPRRQPRRMASRRPPLPLRRLDVQALPRARYWRRRRAQHR